MLCRDYYVLLRDDSRMAASIGLCIYCIYGTPEIAEEAEWLCDAPESWRRDQPFPQDCVRANDLERSRAIERATAFVGIGCGVGRFVLRCSHRGKRCCVSFATVAAAAALWTAPGPDPL